MTDYAYADADIHRRLNVNRLLAALQASPDPDDSFGDNNCWDQVRQLPEPDLPAVEWVQILNAAKRHNLDHLSLRNTPVAAFDQAVVVFDQHRFALILRLSRSWHIAWPHGAVTKPDDLARRHHHNLAAAVCTALQHPSPWARIPHPTTPSTASNGATT